MTTPFPRLLAVAGVAVALVLAGCGDDDTDAGSGTSVAIEDSASTGASDTDAGEATTTSETTATTEAEGTVIEVSVADGEVTGGGRYEAGVGETVTLRVTSDVADHVHLHGYDVFQDVAAGATAELTFEADIPGVFEVELEDSGIQLVELEVS